MPIHDVVGVGFGPANLALAIALAELPRPPRTVFLEREPVFGWHRGMLLDDATMQVSFLKDLVTPRNPVSRFGFVSYLHHHGRLVDFINHKVLHPSRVEFHDYLEWAAAGFDHQVRYGTEVTGVRPVRVGTETRYWDVLGRRDGTSVVHRARDLVLATGITPVLPDGVECTDRIWHSCELLHRLAPLDDRPGLRFAVIGAGQSAAEAATHLHARFADARIHMIMSRYGHSAADDSPFANRVFAPEAVDDFFAAPAEVKHSIHRYHSGTNYSVADTDTIGELYRRYYLGKVRGRQRLHLLNIARVTGAEQTRRTVTLKIESPAGPAVTSLDVDFAVFATGYAPMNPLPLLGEAAAACLLDPHGRVRVGRDYRVVTTPDVQAGIYLQGGTEDTHGISASLLSNTAVRAGEIAATVSARTTP